MRSTPIHLCLLLLPLGCCSSIGAAPPPAGAGDDRVLAAALEALQGRLAESGRFAGQSWVIRDLPEQELKARSISREIFQPDPAAVAVWKPAEQLAVACLANAMARGTEGHSRVDHAPSGWLLASEPELRCRQVNLDGSAERCAGTVSFWLPGYCGESSSTALVVFQLSQYTGDPFIRGGYNVAVLLEQRNGSWRPLRHWSFGSDFLYTER